MRKLLYTYAALLLAVSTGLAQESVPDTVKSAQDIVIESAVNLSEIYIGDMITYTLSITHDSTIELSPPLFGANLGAFDVKDYEIDQRTRLDDGRIKVESRFELTTFTTGDYIIPPIPVEYTQADSTKKVLLSEAIPIRVKSLLAESGDTLDIRELKNPLSFEKPIPLEYYGGGGLLLLIIAALIYLWLRRRRKEETEPVDTRPAWEIAFEKLAFLKERNYPAAGEYKLYYIDLSEIVRDFLQRVYVIPVLDMTTSEFLAAVKETDVDETMYERFRSFLEYADLVKFAKLEPSPDRLEADYIEAWSIIEDIRQAEISRLEYESKSVAKSEPETVTAGSGGEDENV